MNTRISWTASALAALLLFCMTLPLAADEATQAEPSRLQVRHLEDGDRVRVEVGTGRGNSVKLVPFPEDYDESQSPPKSARAAEPGRLQMPTAQRENQPVQFTEPATATEPAATKSVQRLPAAEVSPKSDFHPRFRSPGVRQAQHVEPAETERPASRVVVDTEAAIDDDASQESPGASYRAEPMPAADADGKSLIKSAYARSKQAESEAEYSEIIDLCRRARELGLKPSHEQYAANLMSWAYNRRGEAWIEQQREDEALADFEAAADLNPDSWRAIHNRGVSYAGLGRIDEAIADFDRTVQLNPRYANAYFNRGELLYTQERLEEAIRDYQTAIELGPADAAMHNSLGHTYYRLKRTGDALREYGRALELDANYAPALVNRGDAYVEIGRFGDAAADFRAAITADPSMARAYQAASWLMATCPDGHYRDEKLAVEAANKALQLDGESYRNLEALAAAQASAGQFAEAKQTQEIAIEKAPRERLVDAEKRMALYQKDLAYREVSRQDLIVSKQSQQEEAAEERKFPVQQATAEAPLDEPEEVLYPEDEMGYDNSMDRRPIPAPRKRGFLPSQFNPFNRSRVDQRQPQSQPRTLPKRPSRSRTPQAVRPW